MSPFGVGRERYWDALARRVRRRGPSTSSMRRRFPAVWLRTCPRSASTRPGARQARARFRRRPVGCGRSTRGRGPTCTGCRAPRGPRWSRLSRPGPCGSTMRPRECRRRDRNRGGRHRGRRTSLRRLLPGRRPPHHALRHSHVDLRHGLERSVVRARPAWHEPRALHRVHQLHRCRRVCRWTRCAPEKPAQRDPHSAAPMRASPRA